MYSFEIHFNKYERTNPELQDVQSLYVSGKAILAKNKKFGGLYSSTYVDRIKNNFAFAAGSNVKPILFPVEDVVIYVMDFPRFPTLDFDNMDRKIHISIHNIKQYSVKAENIILKTN